MNEYAIIINGVKHTLVKDTKPGGCVGMCSLEKFCNCYVISPRRLTAPCKLLGYNYHFEILNNKQWKKKIQ